MILAGLIGLWVTVISSESLSTFIETKGNYIGIGLIIISVISMTIISIRRRKKKE